MVATIDAAGRIVVPKQLRESLGLKAGTRLEVSERDGAIVIQPASVPMRLVRRGKTVAVEPDQPLPTLTAEEVRTILESGRR
jgi:AbrB family looped-hinge helix DNA binding protein